MSIKVPVGYHWRDEDEYGHELFPGRIYVRVRAIRVARVHSHLSHYSLVNGLRVDHAHLCQGPPGTADVVRLLEKLTPQHPILVADVEIVPVGDVAEYVVSGNYGRVVGVKYRALGHRLDHLEHLGLLDLVGDQHKVLGWPKFAWVLAR